MTNKKMEEQVSLLRRLGENGVPLSGGGTLQKDVLLMRQIGEPWESRAFDQGNRATGYIIKSNIVILSNNLSISDIYLDLPWMDQSVSLLVDPVEIAARYSDYRFYGKKVFEIDRAEVLNHRLICPGLLSRRAPFQGLLLWSGMEEMPNVFKHAGESPATVTFVDQFHDAYPFQVNLRIDRRNKWSPQKHAKNSREPLFSKRDPVAVH